MLLLCRRSDETSCCFVLYLGWKFSGERLEFSKEKRAFGLATPPELIFPMIARLTLRGLDSALLLAQARAILLPQ